MIVLFLVVAESICNLHNCVECPEGNMNTTQTVNED